MEQTFTLGLSLFDFVPNLAFVINAYFLVRLIRLKNRPFQFVAMITGSSLVVLGGTLKAVWKLLYTVDVGDFQLMSELQFILLAPGFLLMLVSLVFFAGKMRENKGDALNTIAPWKIPLLAIMTVSSLGVLGILGYLAIRRKIYWAGILFVVAIICMLGMAGLAGEEQTVTRQWIEEGINSLGQTAWATGSYFLYTRYKMDK
jgi:hypothetical protein